jgi:hypothetical protein
MRSNLMLASVIAALQSAGHAVVAAADFQSISAPATRRESVTVSPAVGAYGYARGPGWTCAQVKRMATKRRNRARNKRAHRS